MHYRIGLGDGCLYKHNLPSQTPDGAGFLRRLRVARVAMGGGYLVESGAVNPTMAKTSTLEEGNQGIGTPPSSSRRRLKTPKRLNQETTEARSDYGRERQRLTSVHIYT